MEATTPGGPRGRTGRRPGRSDTREVILTAARRAFATDGFAGASVRKIAAAAGVDAALIHHYFKSKQKLFLETMRIPLDPDPLLRSMAAGGIDGLGVRLVRLVLTTWDSPVGQPLAAALRSAMTDAAMAKVVREFVIGQIVGRLLRSLPIPPDEIEVRSALLVSQMVGVITGRYLLQVPPLATLPLETLIPQIGATMQRYLNGPLEPSQRIEPDLAEFTLLDE